MNQYQPHPYSAAHQDFDYPLAHLTLPMGAPHVSPIHVHDNDILMGRGGKSNMHVGNEKLRQMALDKARQYEKADKKLKSILSVQLVAQVHSLSPPGRFLKRDAATMAWRLVPPELAREKASQCLRDAVSKLKKRPNSSACSSGSSANGCNESNTARQSQSTPPAQQHAAKKQRHLPPQPVISQDTAAAAASPAKAKRNACIVNMEALTLYSKKRNRTSTTSSHQEPTTKQPNDDSTTNSIPTLGELVHSPSPSRTPLSFSPAMVSHANSRKFDLDLLGDVTHSLLNEENDDTSLVDQAGLDLIYFQF